MEQNERILFGVRVRGVGIDGQTRCAHYHKPEDVIALRFHCCNTYYACRECHDALTDHPAILWPRQRADEPCVICGVCGELLTQAQYITSGNSCPSCNSAFNPGCKTHLHLYFEDAN